MMLDAATRTAIPAGSRPIRPMSARSLILHSVLFVASLVMLYPLLWMLSASLKPQDEIFSDTSLIPSAISLGGYVRGWNGLTVNFGTFFLNSFVIAGLSIAGNLFACSLTAFAFSRLKFVGRNFW